MSPGDWRWALIVFYAIGLVFGFSCAVDAWSDDRRFAARLCLATPLWPVVLPIALLYLAIKGIVTLFVLAFGPDDEDD